MLREIPILAIPLCLPALLVLVWRLATRQPVEGMPWLRCFAVGMALMAATLVVMATYDRTPPGERYRPPHLEGDQVVPGGTDRRSTTGVGL